MILIDASGWGEFQITDYFDLSLPQGDLQVKKVNEGDVMLITPSNNNNGLLQRISADSKSTKYDSNALTVDMFGNAYFQEEEFFVTAHGHVNVLIPKYKINCFTGTFVATAIRKMFLDKYGFSDMCTLKVLKAESIKLPTTHDGEPDWKYMESYMKRIMKESGESLENLRGAGSANHTIDVSEWKRFHLYDNCLFQIDMGTKLDKVKMKDNHPTVNFVGRANANNGITTRVDKIDGIDPYPAGYMTLSLGGEYLGSCFIQPEQFYTSQNVIVLIPNNMMTDNIKRFLATVIFRESRLRYKAFIDELNRHIKTDFEILLPVTVNGDPDWQYMEDYMKDIIKQAEESLSALKIGA